MLRKECILAPLWSRFTSIFLKLTYGVGFLWNHTNFEDSELQTDQEVERPTKGPSFRNRIILKIQSRDYLFPFVSFNWKSENAFFENADLVKKMLQKLYLKINSLKTFLFKAECTVGQEGIRIFVLRIKTFKMRPSAAL